MNRKLKPLVKELVNRLGVDYSGLFLAFLLDSLDDLVNAAGCDINIRHMEIIYNKFFSSKLDLEKLNDGKKTR